VLNSIHYLTVKLRLIILHKY